MTKHRFINIGMFTIALAGGYFLASFEKTAHAQLTKPVVTAPSAVNYPHVSSISMLTGCTESPSLKAAVRNPTGAAFNGKLMFSWGGKGAETAVSVPANSSATYTLQITGATLDCAKPVGGNLGLTPTGSDTVWYQVTPDAIKFKFGYIGPLS